MNRTIYLIIYLYFYYFIFYIMYLIAFHFFVIYVKILLVEMCIHQVCLNLSFSSLICSDFMVVLWF